MTKDVSLSWPIIPGAKYYNVELSSNPGFLTTVASARVTAPAARLGVSQTGTYYWRAQAVTVKGEENWHGGTVTVR